MTYNHVLLEVYCSYGTDEKDIEIVPEFCLSVRKPGYHCLENNCNHCGYIRTPTTKLLKSTPLTSTIVERPNILDRGESCENK